MKNEIVKIEHDKQDLIVKSNNALVKCENTMKIWNRSRSGVMLKTMTIGGEYMPMRRMRQVSAELTRKRDAMRESKYKVLKKIKRAEIKRRDAEKENDELNRELLLIEAECLEEEAKSIEMPYIGAMQEVVELSNLHDQLEEKVREKYGKMDEEIYEIEEAEYWVRRSFSQSIREVREFGIIKTGNQELLEQIGINPSAALNLIQDFLKSEDKTNLSTVGEELFLFNVSNLCKESSSDRLLRIGLSIDIKNNHLLLEELQ